MRLANAGYKDERNHPKPFSFSVYFLVFLQLKTQGLTAESVGLEIPSLPAAALQILRADCLWKMRSPESFSWLVEK